MSTLETTKKVISVFLEEYDNKETEQKELLLKQFVQFLYKHRLVKDETQFLKIMNEVIDQRAGIPKASVTVQERMNTENLSLLKEKLKTILKTQDVSIEEKIDQRIIGGIKVEVNNKVYTHTIQESLYQLKKTLNA